MKTIQVSSIIAGLLSIALVPGSNAHALANTVIAQSVDPDFAIELQDNTVCSFITDNNVNIRSGPGTRYPVVSQLSSGDGVRAVYREGNWVKLAARVYGFPPNEEFEPYEGWVSNQYINGCSEDQFEIWRK